MLAPLFSSLDEIYCIFILGKYSEAVLLIQFHRLGRKLWHWSRGLGHSSQFSKFEQRESFILVVDKSHVKAETAAYLYQIQSNFLMDNVHCCSEKVSRKVSDPKENAIRKSLKQQRPN